MEFVGKTVRKEFSGHGVFEGVIEAYDSSTGFFRIAYEDGDSEELELSEVTSLVHSAASADPIGVGVTRRGRKPKKRRRISSVSGTSSNNLKLNSFQNSGNLENDDGLGGNLNQGYRAVSRENMLDLNQAFDLTDGLNLDDESSVRVNLEENVGVGGRFDLNLNAVNNDSGENLNGGEVDYSDGEMYLNPIDNDSGVELNGDEACCSDGEMQKVDRGFDLNLGYDDGRIDSEDGEGEGQLMDVPIQMVEPNFYNSLDDMSQINVESVCCNGTLAGCGSIEHGCGDGSGTLPEELLNRNASVNVSENTSQSAVGASNVHGRKFAVQLGETHPGAITWSPCDDGNAGHINKRKAVNNLGSPLETVLRRSTRRARTIIPLENNDSSAVFADGPLDRHSYMSTPECEGVDHSKVLPPMLDLPISSANLNLDGILVLDLFSVYAFLRSFSILLYLSPFELEDFVDALKSKVSNLLLDFIHVSILQTLRKHLEFLSNEGSESASSCLRNLNWDLLDVVTWPIFMVEYLLVHSSGLKPGFDIGSLKLFNGHYYKQPVAVKLEMLRCLCDDVIEVEDIRSELSKRSTLADAGTDFDRNLNNEVFRKRKLSMDTFGHPGSSEDIADKSHQTIDWNSDECCLCRMDGNLICCDGCPAAYHSRCVGVVTCCLPEGEWFCPECAIGRKSSGVKPQKLIRGAELLGADPYGRLYFSSCDYLLVSDSCDVESSFHYYHQSDLNGVIEVLRSSEITHGPILWAIFRHLRLYSVYDQRTSEFDSKNLTLPICPVASVPSNNCALQDEAVGDIKIQNCELVNSSSLKASKELENPVTSSEGSAEVFQPGRAIQSDQCNGISDSANASGGDLSVKATIHAKRGKKRGRPRKSPTIKAKEEEKMQIQTGTLYMNHYNFARTASSVSEELTHKSIDKIYQGFTKSEEELISAQLKAISKKSTKFCWPSILNLYTEMGKEKCGWCFCCRSPAEDSECLFNRRHTDTVPEGLKAAIADMQSKLVKKGHLAGVICHILSMEERLRGLLSGPWLSPNHSDLWRKNVLNSSDVASVKSFLLTLASNLHSLALSAEWWKHVDSAVTMGSASHVVVNSRVTSKVGIGRKRGRGAGLEPTNLNASGGLSLFWWRGGRVSRKLFNWKVVPHSLATKAARKGGSMKIPGVLYSDSSEYAKRSKHVVWWAAVERSTSVEQLALQVRELDLSIRWDDIENTHLNCKLDNESKKSIKLFKKVIIRRKAAQGMAVRYLLDFGRRRIPDVVARHGNMLEESSSERKKYWLDESYVPLHLIKAFEEKRISRKASKMRSDKRNSRKASMMNSNKVLDGAQVMKKPFQRRGLEYLFARAERVENYQCGHCMKDVPISEAVSCQDCCGFFHKRHVRKLSDGITATCTYVCHRCHADRHVKKATKAKLKKSQSWKSVKIGRKGKKAKLQKSQDGKRVNFDNGGRKANLRSSQDAQNVKLGKRGRKTKLKKGKRTSADRKLVQVESSKKVQVPVQLLHLEENTNSSSCVGLRRSARKPKPTMNVSALFDVLVDDEKGKRKKIGNGKSKKPAEDLSWQKKRTVLLGTFWKNGLQLSRKPNDERVMHFKRRKLFVPSELSTGVTEQPKCPLCCEGSYQSAFTYIACELCGGWFHGRAFGLHAKIVESLIGFRCHVCRKRNPPVCPCVEDVRSNRAAPLDEATNNAGIAVAREFPDAVPVETGYQQEKHGLDDARSGSLQESVRTLHKASSDDGQTPVSNLGLQVEVKCVPASEDAITGDIQIHDMEDGLRGNQQVESAENLKLEDNKIEPGGGHLTSLSEAGCRPCNSDGNVTDVKNYGIAGG